MSMSGWRYDGGWADSWRLWLFFFFEHRTAYEMRISDWSTDVCSSDLAQFRRQPDHHAPAIVRPDRGVHQASRRPCRARGRAAAQGEPRGDQGVGCEGDRKSVV